ncbi:hypothetical protein D1007_20918 [Hordeum vulgare]|nr:hypothetical protein D1007_20918 [Hordeum vulgare]
MPEVPRPNGKGVSPNFETYIILIEALVENNAKVKHAKELGMAMKNSAKGDAKEEWEKVEADAFQLALAEMKA